MDLSAATAEAYLSHAFRQMRDVADRLGEDQVNERPVGHDTNSVAALIVHCTEVTEFWLGHVALGRPSRRDRDAEFGAIASVADLERRIGEAEQRAAADIARLEAGDGTDDGGRQFLLEGDTSDAAVVLHVLEELYQHLGHMELTADVLTAGGR